MISNLEDIAAVAAIAEHLRTMPLVFETSNAYVSDGTIMVYNDMGYVVGEFYLEDDFWLFRWGAEQTGEPA